MDLGILRFLLLTSANVQTLNFINDQQNNGDWIRGSLSINSHCEIGKGNTNILKHGDHYDEDCSCYTYGEYYDTYSFLTCNNFALNHDESLNIYPKENIFTYITFKNSAIPVVPVGAFMVFTNTTELYLNNTSVRSIHPGAFTGLTNLHELYLQNNNITEISKGMFNSLPKLKILNLSNNNLHHIEENTFLGLFSIKSLYLGNNKLKYLQKHTFQKLYSLNLVDLSNNLFSNISVDLFKDIRVLTDLNLSFNNLTNFAFSISFFDMESLNLSHNNINNLTFEFMFYLGSIDMSYNNLLKIENLPQSLKQLNLSNNKIKTIDHSLFNKSLMRNTIDLADNLISYLNDETFSNLSKLMYLRLQNNNLSNIPIGCFKDFNNLLVLNLSGNHIDELEYGTFAGLDNLKSLDISNNRLPYLYESSFHNLNHLLNLNIGNNLITSFDPHDLLEYSRALSTVSIDNNPWNCKSLLNIVHEFEKRRVEVMLGSAVKSEHVRGIACSNYKVDNNYFANVKENHSFEHFYKLSTELNSLREFFDKDFLNSSFYRFFESFREINKADSFNTRNNELLRFLNVTFNNTAFHKLLDRDNSMPSYYSLEKAVSKLSNELNLINTNIRNLSSSKSDLDSINVSHYFSSYFENDFKNSTFYKYFHKDFDNSKLVKYFESTFPNQLDIGLSKIRNYFDTDFKNSSFYQLFNNFNGNETALKRSDSEPHFSGLASNLDFLDNNEFLNKLSELSNNLELQQNIMQSAKAGITVFMIIIIILLLTITFLFAFNYVKEGFKRNISRVSYETTEDSRINIANTEMELI